MDFASADREEGDDLPANAAATVAESQDQRVLNTIQPDVPQKHTAETPLPAVHDIPSTAHDDVESQSDDDHHQTRLDPAWGIKRTDSAHILDGVRRSTSFPVMTPTTDEPPQLDPLQSLQQLSSATQDSPSALVDDLATDLDADQPLAVVDPISPVQNATHTLENTEQIRFDEGVPLIQQSQPEESLPPQVPPMTIPDFETNDAEDSFFSQLKSEPPTQDQPIPQPPPLDRKDTVDVIGSMSFLDATTDSPPQKPVSDSKEDDFFKADPEDAWAAAMDDDDEFLVEDADDLLSDSEPGSPDAFAAALREEIPPVHAAAPRPDLGRQSSNAYAPHQPSTAELAHLSGTMYSNIGLGKPNVPPPQQPQASNIVNRAESFVDQSKGGYKSPYDLPMDLAPKRRPQVNRVLPPTAVVPPPPRSSSISSEKQLQSPFTPNAPGFGSKAPMSPPVSQISSPPTNRAVSSSVPPPSVAATGGKRAPSSFFEELPVSSRSRPSPAPQRGPPNQVPAAPPTRPTAAVVQAPPPVPPQVQQPPQQQHSDPQSLYELRQPEKLDPYANIPLQQSITAPAVPVASNRYSPAPPAVANGIRPSPSPRYSPAPPPQAPAVQNRYASQPISAQAPLPFQPRTSSPLAMQRRSVDEQKYDDSQPIRSVSHHSASSSLPAAASLPPPSAAEMTLSPPRNLDPVKQTGFVPPHRSQTQSPSQRLPATAQASRMVDRPASAFGQMTPNRIVSQSVLTSPPPLVVQRRRVAEEIDFIQPTDGSQLDPLQRWKGAPIVKFGFGGVVVRSTPTRAPRYTSGATRPHYKVSSGDVKQQTFAEIAALPPHVSSFPGPLKGKSKKKEVLTWLSTHVASLETEQASLMSPTQPLGDERKRAEEKLLLWKIVRVLVENDGSLDRLQALQAVNAVLMPEVHTLDEKTATQYRGDSLSDGIYRPAGVSARSDTVDPHAVETLRKHLLKGNRSDAVWHAVDTRMWSHALLLASTLDRTVWRQVVQEFVKQEVKTIGNNSESLSAVYEVFGGNMEESIDQLVPPSARAGLQMVSTIPSTGPSKNALDGLDRWRETLSLVLNNRTPEDQRALMTLARLLTDYGRIEAAHVCLLFARSATFPLQFGGVDDPATTIVLLGADHTHHPAQLHLDTDAVLLTEVFDFAVSTLSSNSATNPMPHLAAFKLQRAYELAEAGLKTEALAYCDFIASGMGRSTKQSLYYNPVLLGEVEDLTNRLKQTPMQSSSWMAKPSIEKVSGSVWNKFSSFVTGEDSDAESKGSGRDAAESAPFANVSGSPGPSRSQSQSDLYSSYPTTTPATAAASRYAPNGISSARSSTELTRGRPSFEAQRSPPSTSHSNSGFNSYMPNPQTTPYSYGASPSALSHQPSPDPYMPSVAEEPAVVPATIHSYTPDLPQQNTFDPVQPTFGGYAPQQQTDDNSRPGSEPVVNDSPAYAPPEQSYGGYLPPEDTGYVPYQPEPDSDYEAEAKSRPKKSFMNNDNDDDFPRASAHHNATSTPPVPSSSGSDDAGAKAKRAANDAAADAAFRAAAEADAQRQADAKNKNKRQSGGGWLGGWFGGKKPDSLDGGKPAPTDSKKPVQVHLGESKMKLYYDKEKGKWINPDNPEASEKKAVAPPPRSNAGTPGGGPPMGGPPRSALSPSIGGPPSRTGTPAGIESESGSMPSRPGSSSAAGPIGIGATLPPSTNQSLGISGATPPSRPASALSSASGLDDLLGGAPTGARKVSGRGAGRGKKAGRYVDVMAK